MIITGLRKSVTWLGPALLVALPPLWWVRDATYRASLTTLGRDQGIFQYIAWAVTHGAVDYRDVRDVNGPLSHIVHIVLLALGGRDEHTFRILDLAITGATFALTGACLPGISRSPRSWVEGLVARIGWAFAAWVVLMGQLLLYLYWDLAQRETFCDWFLLPSIGLQVLAQGKLQRTQPGPVRHRTAWLGVLALAGVLSVIPWFGKPTYALFTVAQVFAVAIDLLGVRKSRALGAFALGGLVGAGTQLLFLVRWGDLHEYLRITLVDVPTMYRFMLPRTTSEILSLQWGGPPSALAMLTGATMLALVIDGQMPRRVVAIALLPLCGVVSVIVQHKGFPYHFHPVTAGLHLQWLTLLVWAWERFALRPVGTFTRLLPFLGSAALGARLCFLLPSSPHITDIWILDKGADEERRASHDYLVYFRDHDFFPWEMRQAAEYLREHTSPSDRVQLYGMDPYVLFLAERESATPYIYAYDLDADAALAGSWMRRGLHPTSDQEEAIRAMRDGHESDMLARLERAPPAAFVFIDKAPLETYDDGFYDFRLHNPKAGPWVEQHYRETAAFGEDHIWLRLDLADRL